MAHHGPYDLLRNIRPRNQGITVQPPTLDGPPSPATKAFWDTTFATRLDQFRQLRTAPPQFHDEPDGPGFWSIVRYDHVVDVSRSPALFSSAKGFTIADFPGEALAFAGSMIAMDDPKHRQFRAIVQGAFTHRSVQQIAGTITRHARELVEGIPAAREFDFADIASNLPLFVICELLGIPSGDRAMIQQLSDDVVGNSNATFTNSPGMSPSVVPIYAYAAELGATRKSNPTDDVISRLLHPQTGGPDTGSELSIEEFASFLILLITAGYDTTRQSLNWAVQLLTTHPTQLELLVDDFDGHIEGAIDEIVRWASPVPYMRRTAVTDTEIGGRGINAGDKVVMWYLSANHDESVFAEPSTFDITRTNSGQQLGFGARDPHHCLGVNLARLEIRALLRELLRRYPDLQSGPPDLVLSAFVSGIHRLPCTTRSPHTDVDAATHQR